MVINIADNAENIVRFCYSEDDDLLSKFHIRAPATLDDCVQDTMNVLSGNPLFAVSDGDELIGYFGQDIVEDKPYLTTFFIRKKHRNRQILDDFWETINNSFRKEYFFTAVYAKNVRAFRYLSKHCTHHARVTFSGELVDLFEFNQED